MKYDVSKDIKTERIIIYGKQGEGKTLLAVNYASKWYNRVYSNFTIKYKGKTISKPILKTRDIEYIPFSIIPGVIIFDEMGINFNSKDTFSDNNRMLSEFFFLIRKKNLSGIFLSQRFESIPIDIKDNVDYIFRCRKIYNENGIPRFEVDRQIRDGKKMETISTDIVDNFGVMELNKADYNTMESSKIGKHNNKEEK